MKKRIISDIKNEDFYKFYEKSSSNPIPYQLYIDIVTDYNLMLRDMIVDGYKTYLYKGLSYLFIQEKSRKVVLNAAGDPKLPVSWAMTRTDKIYDKDGKLVRQYIVGDPYYYKVAWAKFGLEDGKWYKFVPCRAFKLQIANRLFNDSLIRLKYRTNTTKK